MSQAGEQPGGHGPANELASLDAQLDALLAAQPSTAPVVGEAVTPNAPVDGAPAPVSATAAAEAAVSSIEAQVDSLVSQFVDSPSDAPSAEQSLADLAESLSHREHPVEPNATTPQDQAPAEPAGVSAVGSPAADALSEPVSAPELPLGEGSESLGTERPAEALEDGSTGALGLDSGEVGASSGNTASQSQASGPTAEDTTARPAEEAGVASAAQLATQTPGTQAPAESIGALDDQLARLTDELLSGEVPSADTADDQSRVATASRAQADDPSLRASGVALDNSTPRDAGEPASTPDVIPVLAVASVAPTQPAAASVPSAPVAATAQQKGPSVLARAQEAVGSRTTGLAAILAKPLAGKPKVVRHTVGWLALNTIFLATLVWGYRLVLQKPEQPVAMKSPIALVAAGGQGGSHAGKGRHSDAVQGDNPEAGPHGGSGEDHEEASVLGLSGSRMLQKKKVTYALSDVMAAKLSAKKDAKKDAPGGEKKDAKKSVGH